MSGRRAILAAVVWLLAAGIVPAQTNLPPPGKLALPPGFVQDRLISGLTGATAMAIARDGRVFVCEQTGALRVVKGGELLATPFATFAVDSSWERGLIGVALDPAFPGKPYVYVNYVAPKPYPHHRVSRLTARGDVAVEGSERILFEGDDQDQTNGSVPAGHQGGAIHFGRDGKLYIALGEQTAGAPSQRLDSLLGKLLRIDPDGTIPADNPFAGTTRGKYRAIWALGLRNPFAFAVQPETGRIFISDVGGAFEEINEGAAGANYGWPTVEHGPSADPRFRGPVYWYPTSSIVGAAFCPADNRAFPAAYRGRLFFADFMLGWIKVLDPARPRAVAEFARGLARPVDLAFAPDGGLYHLDRDAWVIDKDFRPHTGSLFRIRYLPDSQTGDPGSAMPEPLVRGPAAPPPPPPFPSILPDPGTYTGPITVQLHLEGQGEGAGDGTVVRYTTDGTDPGPGSPIYRGPFRLERSAMVKARPDRPGAAVIAARYTIRGVRPYGLPLRPPARGLKVPLDPAGLPPRLSQTGLFRSLATLEPAPGLIPYAVNSPLWSDGAAKRRWVALPGGARITYRPDGEWSFPAGTLFVKHFELPVSTAGRANPRPSDAAKRLETRLLVVDETGGGYGVTYRWRGDGRDADLLADGATEAIEIVTDRGPRPQVWAYPSRDDCLKCHTMSAGFVLGPKTRQLNGTSRYPATGIEDNQLRLWNYLGMFERGAGEMPALHEEDVPRLARLVPPGDAKAPPDERVRSYLDANCANCHRPGANIPAAFDARFDAPLRDRKLIGARTVSDSLGIDHPQVVAPGDPDRSMLYIRMIQSDRYKMPPLARNQVDSPAAELIAAWIKGLPAKP